MGIRVFLCGRGKAGYTGGNAFLLLFLCEKFQYQTPVFMTFNQAKEAGISVLKGSKSFPVYYFLFYVYHKETRKKITFEEYKALSREQQQEYNVIPTYKYYSVFNLDQTNFSDVRPEEWEALREKFRGTDLESKLGMVKGMQITPNTVDRAKTLIKRYFDDKGFKNAEVIISQKDDPSSENQVIVDIDIDKKEKIKVHEIQIVGNHAIKTSKLKKVMKKTNEKGKLRNLFRTKKFVPENFEADKQLIIDKYNELGYHKCIADRLRPCSCHPC